MNLLATLTLTAALAGCSANQPKPAPMPTHSEQLIAHCEASEGEKCHLVALSLPMMKRIQQAIIYYAEHGEDSWL